MQQLVIKNFGPIKDINVLITDFIVLIGPQASGKSTLSKAVYFFKSLRDDLIRYSLEALENDNFSDPLITFSKRVKSKFMDFWGTTHHMKNIYLKYFYDNGKYLTITIKRGYLNNEFSRPFQSEFFEVFDQLGKFSKRVNKKDKKFLSSSEYLAIETEKRSLYKKIESLANNLFNEDKDLIFIPAGRSLLSTLSEQFQNIETNRLDFLMRAFVSRINHSKQFFNKSLGGMVLEKKKLTTEPIDTENVKLAQDLIERILKGRYVNASDGEKLFFDDKNFTRLNYSSSGQQESIWIILLIFLIILDNKKVFVVFEEPEAHLYPVAQKEIVELISLLTNNMNNQIIITTHSPYILSSINNLLYAFKIGEKRKDNVKKIIAERLWINPKQFQAFYISEGCKLNIMDRINGLIKTEAIDNASELINFTYNKLFEIDA